MPDDLGLNLEDAFSPPANTPAEGATLPPDQPQVTPQATDTATTPESAPPDSFTSSSLYLRAQQAGLPVDGIDSADKFQEFLLDQFVQAKPYADYGRSALTNTPAGKAQPVTDLPEEHEQSEFDEHKYFSEAWTVPELSHGAQFALKNGAFDTDERGLIVPAKGLEQIALPYIKEINDYQQAKQAQNESFAANPVKFMAEKLLPYFEHKFSGKWQSAAQEQLQSYQQQNYEQKFIEDNKAWLYTPDGKAFTPEGMKFRETIQQLRSRGITDPETLADWGMKLAGVNPNSNAGTQAQPPLNGVQPAAPAPTTDGKPRDEQGRFLPAGTPAPAPTKQESFLDQVKRKATAGGNQNGHEHSSDFIVSNDGELDNMFTSAWREYAGAK